MDHLPEKHLINDEMIGDTAQQIAKDLRLSELFPLQRKPGETPFEHLFNSVYPEVTRLLKTDTRSLPQIVYQVDLRETLVNEALSAENPAAKLTTAIIKRCFQKVVLRRMYGRGKM